MILPLAKYIMILFLVIDEVISKKLSDTRRLEYGDPIEPEKFPHVVSLYYRTKEEGKSRYIKYCTGTLIHAEWVITAAHCDYTNIKRKYVSNKILGTYKVLETKMNPNFNNLVINPYDAVGTWYVRIRNNICLFRIQRVAGKPRVGKLSVADYKSYIGKQVIYLGFKNSLEEVTEIQQGDAMVVKCDDDEHSFSNKLAKMKVVIRPAICLVAQCEKGTQVLNTFDSGGPLLWNGRVIGVCVGTNPLGAIFTPISPYVDWIRRTLK